MELTSSLIAIIVTFLVVIQISAAKQGLSDNEEVQHIIHTVSSRIDGLHGKNRDVPFKMWNDTGIRELFSMFEHDECERHHLSRHCKRGTLKVDPWLKNVLSFQRDVLQGDVMMDELQGHIMSHNSFNNRGDGYGLEDNLLRKLLQLFVKDSEEIVIAQQEYSMTDQLNMGVRIIMLDPQWFAGKIRLCHAGTKFDAIDNIIHKIEEYLHIKLNVTSEQLGCSPFDRPWDDGIKELAEWASEHPDEVFMIFINDSPGWDLHHWDEVYDPIAQYLSKYALSQTESKKHFPNRWPSINEMKQLGKNVIVLGGSYEMSHNPEYLFNYGWVGYPRNMVKYFQSYPDCGGYAYNKWTCFGGESCIYGPFYFGPDDMGLITPSYTDFKIHFSMKELLKCGIKVIGIDQVSPALMEKAVWTFARNEPSKDKPCVLVSSKDYRWHSSDCQVNFTTQSSSDPPPVKFGFACQSIDNPRDWKISNYTSTNWHDGKVACDGRYQFEVPRNSRDQFALQLSNTHNFQYIWLNIQYSQTFNKKIT